MKIKNVFNIIFSMENLRGALMDACRGRRYKKDALDFALNSYEKLNRIQEDIHSGSYQIDRYYVFYINEPKKRMIMSIAFKHRVVQWAIYRVINPILVKGYISDSYGCIPGRGSINAMKRLKYWLKLADHVGGKWYYLKIDISKYFYRVSHRILKDILAKKIKDRRLLDVLYSIVDCEHTPFGVSAGCDPGDIPMYERLYDVGIPIGNLMSQVFANLYLDALDQFCKRDMRIRYYIRYMDDVIILSDSKEQLRVWKEQIEEFLMENLELTANKKTCIRPVSHGIEFVGFRVWHNRSDLRRSTSLRIKRALKGVQAKYNRHELTAGKAIETLQSYLGMLSHCDSDALRNSIIDSFVLTHNGFQAPERVIREVNPHSE